ncbi:MAG: TonB-dependent receptor plug domain-containing protein, partial [Pseudomonadota bacterium]
MIVNKGCSSRLAQRLALAASTASLLVGFGGPAFSQSLTDEIVVTAQKREQNVQDVGISISVFSGAELEALGVEQSFDIAAFTPGVHISGNLAGQNTQFTIRGVTQNDFNDIIEAPNAVYLDDAYIAVAQGQTFGAFDVERVEILKGPQGTLFGRNATGGLVHYVSVKPDFDELSGFVDATYGRFDSPADANQARIEAAINVPLTDKIAARASILYNYQDPYLQNLYPDGAVGAPPGADAGADLGNDDTLAGRFTLAFEPTPSLRGRIAFNGARSRLNTGPYQSKSTIPVYSSDGELVNVIDTPADETRYSILLDAAGNDTGLDFGTDQDNDGINEDPAVAFGGPPARPTPGGDFFGYL